MEHIEGSAWWTRYQPVSYKLESRSGNESAFTDMIQRCNKAGVRVIIDAVINHMAASSGTGTAGSPFGSRNFPAAGYTQDHFHHYPGDANNNCGVSNYFDINNVQTCDLDGLPDLCTACEGTRAILSAYLKKLLSLGPNIGFRIDAAKHQRASELGAVLAAAGHPWNFQEVIGASGEPVTPGMYFQNGLVTEFEFARKVVPNVKDMGKLRFLGGFGSNWNVMPSNKAVTFLDNHDTQRGEAMLTYKDGDLYYLATVFMLATPYGYPKIMSSYNFDSHDQGPPSLPVRCGSGWVCEHRRAEVANMVAWRRVAGQSPEMLFQEGEGGNRIAFSRGSVAFVAINRDGSTWTAALKTTLPAGTYCDVAQSDDITSCPTVAVDSSGFVQLQVPPLKVVAIHVGKLVKGPSAPTIVV
eukprot:TRINITY_DN334_c1_g1_i1.p1 TRINITY_DN334_c1_g1~~TRINITY_DN334_c1_g1_i1.p1  ORF type:complete len:411 (+),score=65.78 TRINITY_DN334_c1_g1_i1:411-1643(+)